MLAEELYQGGSEKVARHIATQFGQGIDEASEAISQMPPWIISQIIHAGLSHRGTEAQLEEIWNAIDRINGGCNELPNFTFAELSVLKLMQKIFPDRRSGAELVGDTELVAKSNGHQVSSSTIKEAIKTLTRYRFLDNAADGYRLNPRHFRTDF